MHKRNLGRLKELLDRCERLRRSHKRGVQNVFVLAVHVFDKPLAQVIAGRALW